MRILTVSLQKNEIYITPSGIKTSNLEPKDISKVDLNGTALLGQCVW